ncbi:MAG: hypothetical protein LBV18_03545 [Alistipes sp.]|jgi:hypothetical protein|nr:hypothetical protein [Alistipes sp.]
MESWLVILLFAVGAVLFFVVGMSLTLMIKGHHIDSEISTNANMRARGITCAVQDAYAEGSGCGSGSSRTGSGSGLGSGSGSGLGDSLCGDKSCATCGEKS